jgi:hypothetical protein
MLKTLNHYNKNNNNKRQTTKEMHVKTATTKA